MINGLKIVSSPKDAFQTDVVFTMLSDDAVIRDVLISPDVLQSARPAIVHVVTAILSVNFAEELRARHTEVGVDYASVLVSAGPMSPTRANSTSWRRARSRPSTR